MAESSGSETSNGRRFLVVGSDPLAENTRKLLQHQFPSDQMDTISESIVGGADESAPTSQEAEHMLDAMGANVEKNLEEKERQNPSTGPTDEAHVAHEMNYHEGKSLEETYSELPQTISRRQAMQAADNMSEAALDRLLESSEERGESEEAKRFLQRRQLKRMIGQFISRTNERYEEMQRNREADRKRQERNSDSVQTTS